MDIKKKNVLIYGATGSIGDSVLSLIRKHADQFNVVGMTCNDNIEKLLNVQNAALASAVVGFVGREVVADTAGKLPLQDGEAHFEYTLTGDASNVVMTISDDNGRILFTKAGDTSAGKHEVTWDGKDGVGRPMPDGSYNFSITPISFSGETVDHTSRIKAIFIFSICRNTIKILIQNT